MKTGSDSHWRLAAPLLLTTLSALVLELALTRLFSVVLFYHYAFLVISLALLGFATGGILARALPRRIDPGTHRRAMAAACLAACLLLPLMLHSILGTQIWLVGTWEAAWRICKLYLLCMVPFALAGFVIASVLVVGARRIASLYFFDLLGASLGCLLFVPVLEALGGPNTVLVAAGLWGVSALAWAAASGSRPLVVASGLAAAGLAGLLVANVDGRLLDVQFLRGMERRDELFSAWNSFSRISVWEDPNELAWIEIDGGAGTWIAEVDPEGESGRALAENLGRTGPEVAMALQDRPRTLVIGPGGGWDVARALVAGDEVTAVEINPIIVEQVMRGQFRQRSHGLYDHPRLRVHIEDGRSFVQRPGERYDVIQLSQVDTWAASASGAYGLTENYLYTVEAVEAYLGRLAEGGIVSISRWEFEKPRETLRLLAVALEALERRGVARPRDHVALVMEPMGEVARMGTLLSRMQPFTQAQIEELRGLTSSSNLELVYAPGVEVPATPFRELILADDRDAYIAAYPFNIAPVFDDRPFFFFTGRWGDLMEGFRFDASGDSLNASAQFLLVALLAMAALAVAVFVFGPLWLFGGAFPASRGVAPHLAYAASVGLGYIVIEIALIQKFVIFLGNPTHSLTVVIFAMLLSSSLGSRASGGISTGSLHRRGRVAILGILALVTLALFTLDPLVAWAQGWAPQPKLALVAALVFPLGFLMGFPFPSGLRLAAASAEKPVEWAWAMNASATVLGSVLAIFLAVTLGISSSLWAGGLAYGAAALLLGATAARSAEAEEESGEGVEVEGSPAAAS